MMHLDSESGLGRALEKFRPLRGKRLAVLDASGLDVERLANLREAFELAGAEVVLVSPTTELRRLSDGLTIQADVRLIETAPEVYHALCIPGAAAAVAALRGSSEAREFVRNFADSGKWIATLDHGLLLLEDIGVMAGRTVSSEPWLRAGLEHAGAAWISDAVIADQRLVTAQADAQLEAFVRIATLSIREKPSESPSRHH